jgi:hypothetical protein
VSQFTAILQNLCTISQKITAGEIAASLSFLRLLNLSRQIPDLKTAFAVVAGQNWTKQRNKQRKYRIRTESKN